MPSRIRNIRIALLLIAFVLLLAYTARSEEGQIQTVDEIDLFYKVVGKGPETLIVLHGGPGNTMDSILPDLLPLSEKYRVIFYDQRGCGRSTLLSEKERFAIDLQVADLEAVRLHFNIDKLNIIGNSWGGLLASYYALAHPDRVSRLILLSPASPSIALLRRSAPHIHMRIPAESRGRLDRISRPELWMRAQEPLEICREFYSIIWPVYFPDPAKNVVMKGDVCGGPPEALRLQLLVNKLSWEALGDWNIISELATLHTPVLILHGNFDMIPVESSIEWAKALPNSRLLIVPDSGHMTHVEQPAIFFAAVEDFIGGDWPPGSQAFQPDQPGTPADAIELDGEQSVFPERDNLPMP